MREADGVTGAGGEVYGARVEGGDEEAAGGGVIASGGGDEENGDETATILTPSVGAVCGNDKLSKALVL
ncbi:hypothetical protein LguiB_023634 [Lonicera macranthoides]